MSHYLSCSSIDKPKGDKNEIDGNEKLMELKCTLLKKQFLGDYQKENLKQLNDKIMDLRGELEKHKKELFDSIESLKEISAQNKRHKIEKEIENVLDNSNLFTASDSDLNQYLKDLTLAVEQEKNKLSFHQTLMESRDQLKELLNETEIDLNSKMDSEEGDINVVKKLTTFLPSLEESLEKCNDSNEKCAEIINGLQRLILHQNTLRSINCDQS